VIDSKTEIITFDYDHADNRTSMSNASAKTTYTYDASNRMTETKEAILGRTYSTHYGYDGNDNLTDVYYPAGNHVTYVYNPKNQVAEVRGSGWSVSNITYYTTGTSIGLPQSFTYSNGLTTYLTYNKRNLTTDIE
jgi:YD repeat-containing protein